MAARITEKEYADGSKEVYSYDLAGRLVQVVDPAGRTRSFGYAVDDNLLSLTYPQGTGTASVGFTYSPVYNRVATMVDPTGTTTYGYNALGALGGGQVSSVDGPLANDTITYQYDAQGRITQRAINGVARNFAFGDALGRLTQETNSLGQFDYAYDGATSRLATVSAPNGMTTAMSYRALPQDRLLQSITHTGPGSTAISSFEYAYDATGNITHWTQNQSANTVLPVAQWTLSQDGSDQLTGVSVAGHPELTEAYSYDNGGNRLTWQKGDAVTTSAYNVLNQLNTVSGGGKFRVAGTTSEPADVTVQGQPAQMLSPTNFVARPNVTAGTNTITVAATDGSGNTKTNSYQVVMPSTAARSFSYDGNGNLLGDGVRTYEWDGLNRMVKVTKGSDVYEFGYDGLNRRVSETKNGTLLKRFVWDGLALAEERDASNVITKRFLPQGEVQGATSYFYTRDHLGSIRELTGSSGSVVESYGYDAWGRRTLLSGTDLASFGYTGHYSHGGFDLVMAPFRSYDSEIGRWISRDPVAEKGGTNLYGYVANNLIALSDPLGLVDFYGRPAIDYDGDPHAYAPKGSGLVGNDFLSNATRKNGELSDDVLLFRDGRPVINSDGYYVSMTSWRSGNSFINGQEVAYIALGNKQRGDAVLGQGVFMVTNYSNFRSVAVVFADSRGNRNEGVEISPRAARELGIIFSKIGVASSGLLGVTFIGNFSLKFPLPPYSTGSCP